MDGTGKRGRGEARRDETRRATLGRRFGVSTIEYISERRADCQRIMTAVPGECSRDQHSGSRFSTAHAHVPYLYHIVRGRRASRKELSMTTLLNHRHGDNCPSECDDGLTQRLSGTAPPHASAEPLAAGLATCTSQARCREIGRIFFLRISQR